MIASSIVMYGVLQVVNGQNTWIDTVFFVFLYMPASCLLFYYKSRIYFVLFIRCRRMYPCGLAQMLGPVNGLGVIAVLPGLWQSTLRLDLKMQYGKQKSVKLKPPFFYVLCKEKKVSFEIKREDI